MPARPVNLVAALPAEARPIISRFDLKRVQPDRGLPLYRRGHISLVLAGPGKTNAAAATDFLGALVGRSADPAFVNVGIAGHRERHIGEVLLASRIRDAACGRVWHPTLPASGPWPVEALLTLDRPDLAYASDEMLDMEASGFYPTACGYARPELVQVLKVISDNRHREGYGLRAKEVEGLVAQTFAILDHLLAACSRLHT